MSIHWLRPRYAGPLLVLLCRATSATAQATQASELSFTQAQVAQGASVYSRSCASCHGGDLTSGAATPLAGPGFRERWFRPGKSLADLHSVVQTTMPKGAEGSLTAGQYFAVTAYVLERNGVPARGRPLEGNWAALARVSLAGGVVSSASSGGWVVRPVVPDVQRGTRERPLGRGPSQGDLHAVPDQDWLTHTRDLAGTRYSPLAQITAANVDRLRVACVFQVGEPGGFQTGPVIHDGTMYITTAWVTIALDAATCRPKWRHDWPRSLDGNPGYRGVAIRDGYVVRGTWDGYLVALDAADGQLLWSRRIADASRGERITMPPIIHHGLIYVGPAVSENAIRGWVGAFRLEDGERVWRFNVVPEPGEPGAETWIQPKDFPVGGGGVWTPFSIDAQRGLLHVAATNPAPDFPADLRGGTNLYTNSALALDLATGRLRWYDQMVPEDDHDWDLTQVSPLYRAAIGGQMRDLMATAGKDGMLRVLDRETRKRVFEAPVTTIHNAEAPVTRAGTRACPGVLGGVEWNGPAFHPGANILAVPAVDWCSTFFLADTVRFTPGQNYLGGTVRMDSTARGWITAVDASTGAIRWRHESSRPVVAAVTATAGGLIFGGELTGDFIALDAHTGAVRFRHFTGGPVGGGIASYAVSGTQYVAVASGRPSGFWVDQFPGAATITVFALRP